MTVKQLAEKLSLWQHIEGVASATLGEGCRLPLDVLARIPIVRSRATRRLGSYVSKGTKPVCIRLQFAQEPEVLKQTFLHEVAHACDHLFSTRFCRSYRRPHGPGWQGWAQALGVATQSFGYSPTVEALHRKRQKLVAVCQHCGAKFYRVRRLSKDRRYIHQRCGGLLRPVE